MFEYIVFMYVLEADILNTDLESTITKIQILHVDQLSQRLQRHLPRHRHHRHLPKNFRLEFAFETHSKMPHKVAVVAHARFEC